MKTIRLLLADDHALFRKGLVSLLERQKEFQVVGEAENGAEAIKKAKQLKPDLVLMDIHMPETDGIEATRRIRESLPDTRVVILTVSENDRDLFEGIKCGAHGYLLKKLEPEELYTMLRGVFEGEAPISRATASKILNEFAHQATKRTAGHPDEELSVREKEVLQLLAGGLTNKGIGIKLNIAENTVKNHLKNILSKLHLENRVQAATFALQQGLAPQSRANEKEPLK
ncbi:MAG TPA: response regulator transcription factor [Terriglobales bacterium]|jgi:DNA-binding NarL/FixJ family response regulator|nr:response regulator transcription factor [Terriglobales bacterium]